jgi:Mrp family chromosome partitioning ATPase/capsular polysaccharide biosynthesis protein
MHESRSPQAAQERLLALARRWRIFLPFAIVTPLVALAFASSEPAMYESSAEVLLSREGSVIAGLKDPTFLYPRRNLSTQAQLARLPDVGRRVAQDAGLEEGAFGFLAHSSVVADGETDLMTFRVRDGDPDRASRLATTYAEAYIAYRTALDTQAMRRALAVVDRQLSQARAHGADASAYTDLVSQQQRLHTGLAVLEANATLVRPGSAAVQIAPRPTRDLLGAIGLGLVVGLGLAGLVNLLDSRARSADDISEQLGLPLLGRLPLERRARGSALAMLRSEEDRSTEAVRLLRASFELDELGRRQGIVMATSSVAGEGKSTTIANLSAALALAGRTVVLVDLDLRQPVISRLFDLPPTPGIAEVIHGTTELDDVLRTVPLARAVERGTRPRETATTAGALLVVTAGSRVDDPTGLVTRPALASTLESLRSRADLVLLDAPPLLQASDALTLSTYVDGLLFVASTKTYRRKYARELARLFAASEVETIGLVVIGDSGELEPARPYADRMRGYLHRELNLLGPA